MFVSVSMALSIETELRVSHGPGRSSQAIYSQVRLGIRHRQGQVKTCQSVVYNMSFQS